MARQIDQAQMEFGQTAIADIKFNPKSRDDIPKILRGLQHLYLTDSIREPIFKLLEENILPGIDKNNGRPGMPLWKILVLGVLRLDLNCDYDRIHELANQHKTIRQMLGHGDFFSDTREYHLQTIKDNVSLLTPELLEQINQIIVTGGHALLGKKKENEPLRGRCDSFVVETDVHFPTDINLLYDAMRKVIQLIARLCEGQALSDWRQYKFNVKQIKRLMRIAQQKKRVSGKTVDQREKSEQAMQQAHQDLIDLSQKFLNKSDETLRKIDELPSQLTLSDVSLINEIQNYRQHAERQIDQINRRVLGDETIPHAEKVFSIFEPHTDWISKGKAGVPVELGLRVCILEDQHQFILNHRVMEKETDDQVAVAITKQAKEAFPALSSCSYDRGFHSPENQRELGELLDEVGLKRKGKLSEKARAIESSEGFRQAREKHSAVESAINALEVHGLDKCRDHGIHGFKRYVGLAIVARNIHRIGDILHKREQKRLLRKKRSHQDNLYHLAA